MIKKYLAFQLLIIISLISIHEIGHSIMAHILGCKSKAILFDSSYFLPYSYIECYSNKYETLITLAGPIFSFLFSFIFLIFGKEYFIFSISFSLISSSEDLSFFYINIYPFSFLVFIALQFYSSIIFIRKHYYGKNNKRSFW